MKCQLAVLNAALVIGIFYAGTATAHAKPSTQSIVKQWNETNAWCRGTDEQDKETLAWCTVREGLAEVLSARDWCYGKKDEAEYQKKWHKCTADSIK